jgi:hypothetical protein
VTVKTNFWPPRWLMAVFAVLAVIVVGYTFWWRQAASILEQHLNVLRAQGRDQGVTAKWDALAFSGYPLRLRASLTNPNYESDTARFRWSGGRLHVELLPWSLSQFVFTAEGPQDIRIADMAIAGEAKTSRMSLKFAAADTPSHFDLGVEEADASIRLADGRTIGFKGAIAGFHWRLAPDSGAASGQANHDLAINGSKLNVTGVELPFGPDVEDLLVQVTLENVPRPTRDNGQIDLALWREAGAPVNVRRISFVSGGVDISGAGQLRLSRDGFVEGELGLMIGGLDKIVQQLSARGVIKPEARTALTMTAMMITAAGAKAPVPLTFKDGQTFLGPARIGPAPRILF